LVVDDNYNLKGPDHGQDIQKKLKYPNAAKDPQGRLRVGAARWVRPAISWNAPPNWSSAKVDVLAIDTAHGHSSRVIEAVKAVKRKVSRGPAHHRQRGYV